MRLPRHRWRCYLLYVARKICSSTLKGSWGRRKIARFEVANGEAAMIQAIYQGTCASRTRRDLALQLAMTALAEVWRFF